MKNISISYKIKNKVDRIISFLSNEENLKHANKIDIIIYNNLDLCFNEIEFIDNKTLKFETGRICKINELPYSEIDTLVNRLLHE